MKKLLIIILLICKASFSFATVDYLAVNKTTKELYVFDEEQTKGVFWIPIAGEQVQWDKEERRFFKLGYSYTENPYKLDILFHLLLFILACFVGATLVQRRIVTKQNKEYLIPLGVILIGILDLIVYSSSANGFVLGLFTIVIGLIACIITRAIKKVLQNFRPKNITG